MPATAGRVRMPANNRVHSSAALQTHGIWQSAIGYDPYAPTNKEDPNSKSKAASSSSKDDGGENAYASFQGLLALARITGSNANDSRGACNKCGRIGHLTFQCRNFLTLKDDRNDPAASQQAATAAFDRIRKASGAGKDAEDDSEGSGSEEEDESESSDSDYDSEIERIIAERNGKKSRKSGGKRADVASAEREKKRESRRSPHRKRSGKRSRGKSDKKDGEVRMTERKHLRDETSDDDDDRKHRHRKSRRDRKCRSKHRRRDDSGDDSSSESSRRHKRHKKREREEDNKARHSSKRSHRHENRRMDADEIGGSDGDDFHRRKKGREGY